MFKNFGRKRGTIAKIWGFRLNNGQNGSTLYIASTVSTEKDEKAFAFLKLNDNKGCCFNIVSNFGKIPQNQIKLGYVEQHTASFLNLTREVLNHLIDVNMYQMI